jgi:hypothetical protein
MNSPYPNAYRSKARPDDFPVLQPEGCPSKGMGYEYFEMKDYGYEWGAKLSHSWDSYGASVPIFSFSDITGMYGASEVVY